MTIKDLLTSVLEQLQLINQNLNQPSISPEIIVALIAAFVAVFTLLYNKQRERHLNQRNLKEQKYISFLSALILLKGGYGTSKELIETIQIMNLIGSSDVVQATSNFIDLMITKTTLSKDESPSESEPISPEAKQAIQDQRYNALIKSMRTDLYGKKCNKEFPSELPFVVFGKTDEEKAQDLIELLQKKKLT